MPYLELYADVCCPFTHVGLRRIVEQREARRRDDVLLHVHAWPLEIVNAAPLAPDFIADEIEQIRASVAPDLFRGFDIAAFPASSIPALALAARAYARDMRTGESVSLALRDALFERGLDTADPDVLADIGAAHAIETPPEPDPADVMLDYESGRARGVIGSPHFFTPDGDFFCPALDIAKQDDGHLRITADPEGFEAFLATCFA